VLNEFVLLNPFKSFQEFRVVLSSFCFVFNNFVGVFLQIEMVI